MLILKNGRIVDPASRVNKPGSIWIKNGKIEKVVVAGKKSKGARDEKGYKVIDVNGAVISPGLIDMHVHLREPGFEYKEDILSGSMAAAKGGFTSVVCMPNTKPVNDSSSVTKYIIDKAKSLNLINVFPVGCVSKKMEGKELAEYGDMRHAGAVAFSDDGLPVGDSSLFRRALEYASDYGVPIIDHCEDLTLRGRGVMHEGAVSTRIGLAGIPCETESVTVTRDIELLRITKGKLHLAHISCEKSLKAIRAGKREKLAVTCEVTPHHFTLTDEAVVGYDTNTKMNPPLRPQRDVSSVREALKSGLVDVIASDHAPHAEFEKNVEYDIAPFGIVGLETTLSLSLALVEKKIISLSRMIELLSVNPSKILKLGRARISKGCIADITVFDPKAQRVIEPANFASKSRNTPFGGMEVKGEVILTIVGGRVVYEKE